MAVQSGRLEPLKLFKVFRSMLDRRMSGVLTVKRGHVVKKAHVVHGYPVRVASNVPQESLGWALVEEGLISSTEFQEVEAQRQDRQQSLESVIVGRNLVAPQRLRAVESRLGRRRLLDAFGWPDGTFIFEPGDLRADKGADVIDVVGLLMEAAARTLGPELCDRFVSAYQGRVVGTEWMPRYSETFDALFPPPNVRALLGRPISFDDIAMRMADRGAAARQLAALVLGGLATFSGAGEGTQPPRAPTGPAGQVRVTRATNPVPPRTPPLSRPPAGRATIEPANTPPPLAAGRAPTGPQPVLGSTGPQPVRGSTGSQPVRGSTGSQPVRGSTGPPPARPPSAPPSAATRPQRAVRAATGPVAPVAPSRSQRPAPPDAGAPPAMPEKLARSLEQARRLAAELGDASPNYYDLLGVARDADDKAIRAAYRLKARDYHGDRFARFKLAPEDAAAVQKVFIAVNRAHEALTDAAQRKEHDARLEMEARGQKVDPSGDTRAHIAQALKAEKLVRNGANLLRGGKAQAALERFDEALAITPDDLIAISGRAYAEALVARQAGPAVQILGRAREKLEGIVGELAGRESEFGQPEPFLYLGLVYVLGEQWEKAEHVLKQAIAIQAHCDEAVSTLRHVQRRAAEPQKGLKGLFGRRKK